MSCWFFSKRIVLSGICVSFFLFTSAQGNLKHGTVILNNGDSLQGYFDYREWKADPSTVYFYKTPQAEKLMFSPHMAKSYQVDGDLYVSACVRSRINAMESGRLLPDTEPQLMEDTVFLQVLVDGPRSLYYYRNKLGNDNYYFKQDSVYNLLIFNKYVTNGDAGRLVAENNKYRGQLNYYMKECSNLKVDPMKVKYQKNSMLELYQAFYTCTELSPAYIDPVNKPKVEFSLIMWGAYSGYAALYNYDYLEWEYKTNYSNQFIPSAGVEVIFPKRGYRWSINNELSYNTLRTEGTSYRYTDEANNTLFTVHTSNKSINLNTMARYRIPFGKGSFFINGGLVYGLVWEELRTTHEVSHRAGVLNEESYSYSSPLYASVLGLSAGTGVRWNAFSLEYRHITGFNISHMIGIGYRF
jgi:hypothetical protein